VQYDLIIRGGTVVDGSGRERFQGDIAVEGNLIAEIGDLKDATGANEIDAQGKIVCPGFIDIHSHVDFAVADAMHVDRLEPLIRQGVTTVIGGNCGFSSCFASRTNREANLAFMENLSGQPLGELIDWNTPAEFFERLERQGMLINMGTLVGHGSLRIAASGLVTRLLTPDEQARLERYLEQALEMGCMGLSTGLQYFPGLQSDTVELVGLGNILKRSGGVFTSHLRSYVHTIANAIDEVSEVGRRCGVPVQISHLYWQPYAKGLGWLTRNAAKIGSYAYNTLKIPVPIEKGLQDKIELIDTQRRQGVDIAFDLVPTSQGFTELFAFLPPYVSEGSKAEALLRLKDRAFRKKVRHDIFNVEPDWPHRDGATWSFNYIKMTGWEGLRVMAVMSDHNRWMEGLTFPEVGAAQGKEPFDALCDLLVEEKGQVMVFHTPLKPDDPFAFRSMWLGFTHPCAVPATDTILRPIGRPAHVFYDCFPRFIAFFTRQKPLLTLEEAVRKTTSRPAEIMRIKHRGTLRKGYYADITVFDYASLGTAATFANPAVYPSGIEHVIINGRPVLSSGIFRKDILAGAVIRRTD
jgi:N-acyl-D-amino-acid deacylase